MEKINREVSRFLDDLSHPLRVEIEALRLTILYATDGITENIKWNGPNYCHDGEDRITMRVQPPKQIQLIFHRGAKKLAQPATRMIDDQSGLLIWKDNDRAVASFKDMKGIKETKAQLQEIVRAWCRATKSNSGG